MHEPCTMAWLGPAPGAALWHIKLSDAGNLASLSKSHDRFPSHQRNWRHGLGLVMPKFPHETDVLLRGLGFFPLLQLSIALYPNAGVQKRKCANFMFHFPYSVMWVAAFTPGIFSMVKLVQFPCPTHHHHYHTVVGLFCSCSNNHAGSFHISVGFSFSWQGTLPLV